MRRLSIAVVILISLLGVAAIAQQGPPPIGSTGGKTYTGSAPIVVSGTAISCPTCGTGTGTVSSVSFTGGLISIATPTSTPAFTVAGTSGGIPYFSGAGSWATSAALTANALVKGGGAGAAPSSASITDDGTTVTIPEVTINSVAAAASTPSLSLTGTPFTSGGTGTTTFPQVYINKSGNTAPSTWSTSGTLLGINGPSGFNGNVFDYHPNGGASNFFISSGGTINAQSQYILTASTGAIQAKLYQTITNCSSAASPAVCAAAGAGSVAIPAGALQTLQVNTTAVTANSQILLTIDEGLGTKLSVTCNTTIATLTQPVVTARTGGSNFTIEEPATTSANPVCVSYLIFN